jgi:hypothetical protein
MNESSSEYTDWYNHRRLHGDWARPAGGHEINHHHAHPADYERVITAFIKSGTSLPAPHPRIQSGAFHLESVPDSTETTKVTFPSRYSPEVVESARQLSGKGPFSDRPVHDRGSQSA